MPDSGLQSLPQAFTETGIKDRIENAIDWKKNYGRHSVSDVIDFHPSEIYENHGAKWNPAAEVRRNEANNFIMNGCGNNKSFKGMFKCERTFINTHLIGVQSVFRSTIIFQTISKLYCSTCCVCAVCCCSTCVFSRKS